MHHLGRLAVHGPTQVGELLVEQLEDVEVVEHDHGLGQVGRDRLSVRRRHVHGHRLDLRPAGPQPLPERLECVGPPAVADEDDRPAHQVHDDRQVAMPLGDSDLVDGDPLEVLQLGLGEAAREIALLDLLDRVPSDAQVAGDIADGHAPRQLQGVPLEGPGIGAPGIGKGDLDLTDHVASRAFDTGYGQCHDGRLASDGDGPEAAFDMPARPDVRRPTGRAAAGLRLLMDGEDHLAALRVGAGVSVAADAEGVIQQAGGHADLPIWSPLTQLQLESACPTPFNPALASPG